jgi:hypothetical protein
MKEKIEAWQANPENAARRAAWLKKGSIENNAMNKKDNRLLVGIGHTFSLGKKALVQFGSLTEQSYLAACKREKHVWGWDYYFASFAEFCYWFFQTTSSRFTGRMRRENKQWMLRCINLRHNHSVAKIELIQVPCAEPVYDIAVEDNHNFLVNAGVIVHNSYWGYRYIATRKGVVAPGYAERRPPKVRNPLQRGIMCKHLALVLSILPFNASTIAKEFNDYFIEKDKVAEPEEKPGQKVRGKEFKEPLSAKGKHAPKPGQKVPPKPTAKPGMKLWPRLNACLINTPRRNLFRLPAGHLLR